MHHPHHNCAGLFVEQDEEVALTQGSSPHWTAIGWTIGDDFWTFFVSHLATSIYDIHVQGQKATALAIRFAHGSAHMSGLIRTHSRTRKVSVGKFIVVHDHLEHID